MAAKGKRLVSACLGCILLGVLPGLEVADAEQQPIKAVVIRSTGTMFLGQTIWSDLNSGWSAFGDTPVEIDYTSLGGYDWSLTDIQATSADVLILSAPGYMGYTVAEIAAVKQYIEDGHGLIYTYGLFRGQDKALAPLVGLSESIQLGTGITDDPLQFDLLAPDHAVFDHLNQAYVSGVRARARPHPNPWELDGGVVLANQYTAVIPPGPGIIAHETSAYRGLYFSHYIEDKADGTNQQDMQVFYNGLVWTGTPEPASVLLLLMGSMFLTGRQATKRSG